MQMKETVLNNYEHEIKTKSSKIGHFKVKNGYPRGDGGYSDILGHFYHCQIPQELHIE